MNAILSFLLRTLLNGHLPVSCGDGHQVIERNADERVVKTIRRIQLSDVRGDVTRGAVLR